MSGQACGLTVHVLYDADGLNGMRVCGLEIVVMSTLK